MDLETSELIVSSAGIENPRLSLSNPDAWDKYFDGPASTSGAKVTPKTATGYPPLWRALNLISGDVAKLPIDVYRRLPDSGKVIDRTHPASKVLRKQASRILNSFSLKRTMVAHALLRGNAYALIARNNRNEISELLLLDPDQTAVAVTDDGLVYSTQVGRERVAFSGDDVFHLRGLSNDGIVGHDVVTLMRNALGLGMAAAEYASRFFSQGANMSGLLLCPGHFSDEKIRNTINAFNKIQTGLSQSHRIGLLQDGVKWQPMSVSPQSAQLLDTRAHEVRATVANILGCPPHKIGDDSRTSHNSLESEQMSYLNECLDTWLCEFEQEANSKLLTEQQKNSDSHFIEFNRNALLRMNANDRADYYTKMQMNGNMTVNDVLRAESMPVVAEGDRRYRPANLIEIGNQPEQKEAPTEAAALSEVEIATLIQKVYLGVGKVLTSEEARQLVTQAGFNLQDSFVPDTAQPLRIEPPEIIEDSSPAAASLRAMVDGSVSRSLQIEKDRVIKAASNEKNFLKWIDDWYPHWVENATLPAPDAESAFSAHAQASKIALIDVASCTSQTELAGAVAECVATWSDRGQLIINKILKGAENNG